MSLKVVFMGTPDFAVPCLEKLVSANYDIAAVVTQPDRPKGRGQKLAFSPVKECALKYELPVWQPEKIKDEAFINQISAQAPDVIVVVAYGRFLPKILLDLPRFGCINVHASLLPQYRGAAPIHWAIIHGEIVTGVTTMFMDIGMDTGDMLLKASTGISPDETTGELHDKLKLMGADLLLATLAGCEAGSISREKQDDAAATYAPLLKRETERIDWQKPAAAVHNLVRGLNPWPGAYCEHQGKILKIWRTEPADFIAGAKPGLVAAVADDGIVVGTGSGCIKILELQPQSKKKMACKEYIRGNGLNVGEVLR